MKSIFDISRTCRYFTLRSFSGTTKLNRDERKEGPLPVYNLKVKGGDLLPDPLQLKIATDLQDLYERIERYDPPRKSVILSLLNSKSKVDSPKGLYIYGAVGTGKTTLMDLFYSCIQRAEKRRVHFHSFMLSVHSMIHELKKENTQVTKDFQDAKPKPMDVITPVAEEIARKSWLICFDEFQVTDIGDAMILKRLFTSLFSYGVIMVATSNRKPDDLYMHGVQRSNFVPFIQILKDHCNVVPLDSGIDYRTKSSAKKRTYFVKGDVDSDADEELNKIFQTLCSMENDIIRPKTLTIMGRNVTFNRTCGQIIDTTFQEICARELGTNDYIHVSQAFHTVFIRDLPQLSLRLSSETRRFITLIDTFYDNKLRVFISANVPLSSLFLKESMIEVEDSTRTIDDDRHFNSKSDNTARVVFRDEEVFAFDRTVSRLSEMQTLEYWHLSDRKR